MRPGRSYQLHVGTASILLVFLTLCLSSFAVLTLVNANADKRLSDKLSARTLAYYEAVAEAEEWIAASAESGAVEGASASDGDGVTKDFPFDENQYLRVTIESGADGLTVTEYRVYTDETEMNFDESPFKVTR
ncbi:MAG: hypothetical protein IJR00_10930 [Lachnospiraceae bacterium]|nr:hypothetical protein [Lachnospiraceae bacterium]